jgi:hypothetical protein
MSISFAATPQSKEAQQARTYTDPSAGAPPSRRSGYNAPYVDLGHWNKVFTDQNYFDSIAKQKGMTEGAKVSLHGDDYVYRQAMIGFLADTRKVPLDDMRSIFDAEKDGFAKTVLGKQTASAREMFDWQKGQFERDNEKQAAARMIEESVMRRSLEDAFSGGDTPFVESVAKDIEAAGDLFDEEEKSRLWEKAEQLDKQIRASQAQFAPEARYIFNALRQYSGESAGFGAPEMADLAGRLAKLPTNQRRAIMQLAGSFGQLQQIDKGFWYQMAESIGRGTTDFSERIPRNAKEQTLRGNLRLLKSEQPVFKGVGLDGAVAYSAAGETPITPEEREQAIQDAEQQVGVLMVQRELRELAETQIDPIKTVTMLPSWVEEGLYGAARSVPYTAAAAVPVAGVFGVAAALYSKFYDQMMVEYPDADPNDVALVAAIGAPVAAGLERLKLNTIMGRLPIFGRLVERLVHPNQKNVYRIMWRGGGMIAEQNVQEFAQERVYPLGQSIASALGADIPSYDWEKWYQNLDRELLVQFVALLPLSLLGMGTLSYREIKRGDAYLKDKPTLMKVLSEAATDRVLGAATTEEAQAIFREEYAKRTPEEAKAAAQRVVDEVVAVRQQQQSPDMPKLERRGAEYVVVSPDGQTLAASTDQTTAEQALLSASREVVEKELMVERQRFADTKQEAQTLKEWWLAEDPKRQANERRVIREGENQITAQQKLEMLEKAGNKQGIEELHRRIAQSPYSGTAYDKIFILGEASVEQVGEMVFQSVIALNPNSDVRAAREEMHHTAVRVAVANGRADESMLRGWLEQSERVFAEKGVDIALPRADMTDIVESMAVMQEAFENERISADVEMSLPQAFVDYIKRMIEVFVEVLKRGKALREAFDAGALPSDFEAFLAETTGVADQTVVDRSREKTAQEVAPEVANYSIGLQSFKDWFGDWENDPANASKVVDENGRPKVVYHGTQRPDRIGSRFRKSRATSGPMAFFTANPEIGSSYAKGKSDTSLELPSDYAGWFKYKGKGMRSAVDIDRAWWSLSEAERETIRQRIYTVGYENADEATGPIVSNSSSIMGRDSIDYELRQARGNALRALVETWLTSGSLFNREEEFMQVLEAAGMDMARVTYDSPFAVRSAVYPVYLSIKNPLNTSNIPADVFAALEQAGKRKRAKRSAGGNADAWDKNTISGKDWLEALRYDMETGSTMAWTRIPDWATETLAMLGYDGIHDTGGKYGGEKHDVWIPFVETQVKSATGNRGTFDPTNPDINYSIGSRAVLSQIDSVLDMPENPPSVETAAQEGGKVRSIAKLFREIMGEDSIDYGSLTEEGMAERISEAGDRMLDVLLRAAYEFPQFASWYESRLKMALDIFTELDPDVAKPDNQAALLITLAITSNGADVATQTEDGWDVYNHWKQSGRLAGSVEKRGSQRGAETENKLVIADKLADALGGYAKLGEFLNRKGTVSELRTAMTEQLGGTFTKEEIQRLTNGELVDEIVPFSLIFGPKLGSFFNNMSGDFSTITMDRWFMRTFGRTMGTQLVAIAKNVMAKKDARLKQALKGYKGDILQRAKIAKGVKDPRQIAEALGKFFQKSENRSNLTEQENAIRLAANDLFKVADGFVLKEAPDSGTHRRWIRAAMTDAITKFNAQTNNQLVPAEAQALLWYYEKLVHDTYGSRQKDASPDYASAANKLFVRERGVGSDRFQDSDGIKRRSGGGRSAAFGGLSSGGESGAAVDNYSISTQSEIDRVGAALNRLDRDPLERVKIYEKAQEKFLRVMADNREMLAGMQDGDLAQMRRTQILQALGELDGIISVLPPEVRSKIGGYTQLAKVDPMDVFKGDQKVSEVRGMSGAIISAWMREGLNIGEAQKKTELPAGYRAERNLDPTRADRAIADVFIQRINRINEALEQFLRDEYNTAAVELFKRAKPQRSGAGEKPKGKLGADVHDLFDKLKEATEWSAEEAQAYADGQWARIENGELNPYEETHAMMAAQMVPLFADWANADSSQRAAAVTMGKDVLNRAYKGEQQRIIAQRTKRGYDRTDLSKDAGVSAEDDKARQDALKRENSLPAKWESAMLNLLNFDQVLRYIFGNDSKIARQISDRQRKADNAKSDDIAALSDEWAAFLSELGGGEMQGQQLLFELSRMDEEIDGVSYSQNQLIAITMMWMQPKGRQHMEGFLDSDGQPAGKWHYNQDFVNKAEKLLRGEAKAIRQYLLEKYDAEYEAINKVYRKVYGLNLPKNQFYSPLVVESIRAPQQAGIDPVTGGVFAAGANSPSALRSRGGAIAQPVFRDAVQTYFGHMLQMAHWKAYAEFNGEVSALLGHRDTRNVVKGKAGEQAATVMNNWLQYFQQGGNKDAANHLAINQMINRMTGNFATMALFGRISTLALQVTQLGAASAKMPVGAYLSRFGKLMSGRLGWKTALDSAYIQRRIKDMPPAVALAMQGLRSEKPNAIREAARRIGSLISGFDGLFTAGTYAIVYDYQMTQARQNGMGGQEAADYAREATERIVDEIAQPTRAGARSIFEINSTNPVARAVWAFSSEARKNLGLGLYAGAKGSGKDFGKAVFYVLVLNGLVGTIIRNAFRDLRDDDDEETFDEKNWGWNRMAAMLISDPLYGFPVVGEAVESAIFNAFGVYTPTGPLFDIAPAVPAAKRMLTEYPAQVLEGEAEFRDIVRDVNRILSTAGLFNNTIAGAAAISNLVKDTVEVGDNVLNRDE